MAITAEQVKSIRQELDKLRPAAALSGNRELSVKQTIFALAPALERMKKRGFELPEIVAKLAEKGIEVGRNSSRCIQNQESICMKGSYFSFSLSCAILPLVWVGGCARISPQKK